MSLVRGLVREVLESKQWSETGFRGEKKKPLLSAVLFSQREPSFLVSFFVRTHSISFLTILSWFPSHVHTYINTHTHIHICTLLSVFPPFSLFATGAAGGVSLLQAHYKTFKKTRKKRAGEANTAPVTFVRPFSPCFPWVCITLHTFIRKKKSSNNRFWSEARIEATYSRFKQHTHLLLGTSSGWTRRCFSFTAAVPLDQLVPFSV